MPLKINQIVPKKDLDMTAFCIKTPGYGTSYECVGSMKQLAELCEVRYVETAGELG
jgi:hypothetical protein